MGDLITTFQQRRNIQLATPKFNLRCRVCEGSVTWRMGGGNTQCECGNIRVSNGMLTVGWVTQHNAMEVDISGE